MPSNSPLNLLAVQLLRYDEASLPRHLLNELHILATKTSELMNQRAGVFLHVLDNTKHSEKNVKAVINTFPRAISHTLEDGRLPIHSAATRCPDRALSFIPLLAREGILRNAGVEGERGGLFGIIPRSCRNSNLIQLLANMSNPKDPTGSDLKCLQVLQGLKEMGLLYKEDIKKHSLLFNASYLSATSRFEFFARWDPLMLKVVKSEDGVPLIHDMLRLTSHEDMIQKKRFELVFKTCAKYFPDELGLLFLEHEGRTTFEVAFHLFGREETMKIICRYIPPSSNRPVLHHVIKYAPHFIDIFTCYYYDATYVRDSDGRTLFLASLASGNMSFESNATFFSMANEEQIAEKDPVSDLFPFALAASGSICDLDAVYTLLRRVPGLIYDGNVWYQ